MFSLMDGPCLLVGKFTPAYIQVHWVCLRCCDCDLVESVRWQRDELVTEDRSRDQRDELITEDRGRDQRDELATEDRGRDQRDARICTTHKERELCRARESYRSFTPFLSMSKFSHSNFVLSFLCSCVTAVSRVRALWYASVEYNSDIIKGFRTIVFIFIVISTTLRLICPSAFFRSLSNSGAIAEFWTTSFIESTEFWFR